MISKYTLIVALILTLCVKVKAQEAIVNEALAQLKIEKSDTVKVHLMGKLSFALQYIDFNKSLYYATQALKIAKKADYQKGISKSYNFIGLSYATVGKFDMALKNYLLALSTNKKAGIEYETPKNLNNIAEVLIKMGDVENAKKYISEAYTINNKYKNNASMAISLVLMARFYSYKYLQGKAIEHLYLAKKVAHNTDGIFDEGLFYSELGDIYLRSGNVDSAEIAFKEVLNFKTAEANQVINAYYGLATITKDNGKLKESEVFFKKALEIALKSNTQFELIEIYAGLSDLALISKEYKTTINYMSKKDSLQELILGYQTSGRIFNGLNNIITEQKELENAELRLDAEMKKIELSKQKVILIILLVGITFSLILGFIAYSNFIKKNNAFKQLHEANQIIRQHNTNLEDIVAKRTNTIFLKNKKLKELAYFNSHRVRKHLANILGLIYLVKDEGEKREYLDLIESEAQSLDETINQISKMIDD